MSVESQAIDPYDAVLADLRSKREQIEQAIQVLEALRSGHSSQPSVRAPTSTNSINADIEAPGAFLGMTIVDAAKKLLAGRRKTLSNGEIAAAFKAGGLVLTSADPVNTVGSVLTRRFKEVGDVVKLDRGIWGLAEWYPGRNFKKKAATKLDGDDEGVEAAAAIEAAIVALDREARGEI